MWPHRHSPDFLLHQWLLCDPAICVCQRWKERWGSWDLRGKRPAKGRIRKKVRLLRRRRNEKINYKFSSFLSPFINAYQTARIITVIIMIITLMTLIIRLSFIFKNLFYEKHLLRINRTASHGRQNSPQHETKIHTNAHQHLMESSCCLTSPESDEKIPVFISGNCSLKNVVDLKIAKICLLFDPCNDFMPQYGFTNIQVMSDY